MIFHIDVNSAFLSWEAAYRINVKGEKLDLRTIPSVVGGDIKKRHGVVLAKSTLAKAYGIKTGSSIMEAKKRCPNLVIVPPHYNLYEDNSKAFIKVLKKYSPCVEQYSIDEAFCDMTQVIHKDSSPEELAYSIKDHIEKELGFTVNIGISTNKLLAKMASDFEKPNRVHTLYPNEIQEKMWPLPVRELYFVGKATEKKLQALGIMTIGELANTDVSILKAHLKKHGELIHDFANGIDISLVEKEQPRNKGYGNSTTIAFDVEDPVTAKLILLALCESVGTRLRQHGVVASVLSVSIVDCEFHHSSHQRTLYSPTNSTSELHEAICCLFDEQWDGSPIRQLGVHTSKVRQDIGLRQLNLFDMEKNEKLEKLDKAIDSIRNRFGADSVMRASFIDSKIYHMSGGISSEKRKPQENKESNN